MEFSPSLSAAVIRIGSAGTTDRGPDRKLVRGRMPASGTAPGARWLGAPATAGSANSIMTRRGKNCGRHGSQSGDKAVEPGYRLGGGLARGAEVLTVPCDVGDQAQVETALGRIVDHYGAVDVLINNA